MPERPVDSARDTADWGSWESSHERKITLALHATPAQRLAWLEEVIVLAHACGALPRPREVEPTG